MSETERVAPGVANHARIVKMIVLGAAAAQCFMAVRFFGFLTGDDVEVLEEAFRVAAGFRYRAWDIRNLFVPDFIYAPPIWLARTLEIENMRALIVIATIPSMVAHAISIVLVHRLTQRFTATPHAAVLAAGLFAFHWIPLGYGSTVYPRNVATACILGAAMLLVSRAHGRAAFVAGALAGLAFADRFSEGVFLIPLMLLAGRRAWGVLAGFAASAALIVGFYDWVTWGEWFGSLRKFAHLTLVESDFSSRVKHQSTFWYLLTLQRWLAPTLLPLMWIAVRRDRRVLAAFVLIPLVALSIVAHKESRYLHGVIPYAMILAAIGFERGLKTAPHQPWRKAAVLLIAIAFAWHLYGLGNFARKSMAAVEAAQMLGADESVRTVAMSQLWAYGGSLYFGQRMSVVEMGVPPQFSSHALGADVICLYSRDVNADVEAMLRTHGFLRIATFRNARSRNVVVFRR